MPAFLMNGKRAVGMVVCLWVVIFLAAAAASQDLSSPAKPLHKPEDAFQPGDKDKVVEPPSSLSDEKQELQKAMDEVFRVLNTIMREEGLSLGEKKKKVMEYIRTFRYGPDNKDYFWINDLQGVMLVDPYLPDFEGKDFSDFSDPNGIKVFEEFIKMCREEGEGYVTYLWPKYEQKKWNVPKLSLVRLLKPWGWIIGTGLYLETVEIFDMPEEYRIIDSEDEPASAT